mmetsp:Transcript_21021/g.66402  ORF Transcript_21021/g.66402 Transcript_21021/m.66402 type:complete len:252 (+) Transcript_21021:93-848(+)
MCMPRPLALAPAALRCLSSAVQLGRPAHPGAASVAALRHRSGKHRSWWRTAAPRARPRVRHSAPLSASAASLRPALRLRPRGCSRRAPWSQCGPSAWRTKCCHERGRSRRRQPCVRGRCRPCPRRARGPCHRGRQWHHQCLRHSRHACQKQGCSGRRPRDPSRRLRRSLCGSGSCRTPSTALWSSSRARWARLPRGCVSGARSHRKQGRRCCNAPNAQPPRACLASPSIESGRQCACSPRRCQQWRPLRSV